MIYKISSRLAIAFALISLGGCGPTYLQSPASQTLPSSAAAKTASGKPLTLKEAEGAKSIANPDGSVTVLPAPSSKEDFLIGSESESGERSNADIADDYGDNTIENDNSYNFEALPPVTPQEKGSSGLFF